MSWDFAVHGRVVFPGASELEAWLDLPIDQPGGVDGPLSTPVDATRTARASLAAFRSSELHVERQDRRIKLHGWVEKTAMIDLGPPLVGALFSAARAGASGGAWLIAVGNTLAYRVRLRDGSGTLRKRAEDMESSELVAEAMAAMRLPFANTWLLPPTRERPEDYGFTVGEEQHGKHLSEVLTSLRLGGKRRLTKGDVQKAVHDGAVYVDGHAGRSHDLVAAGQRVCLRGWGWIRADR